MGHPLCSIIQEKNKQGCLRILDANSNRCRYHPLRNKGREVNVASKEMCPLAYSNLYPVLFALLCSHNQYKSRLDFHRNIKRCPLGSDGVSFNIYTKKIGFKPLRCIENIIRKIINLIIPFEIHNKDIIMEVIDEGRGCHFGMRKGDIHYFNINNKNELCPAAFYSVYPFIDLVQDGLAAGCPDYQTHIRFTSINNIRNIVHVEDNDNKCDSYSGRVKIIHTKGNFLCPIKVKQWYSIDELIDAVGISCYTSFHVAFPYLYVLSKGGQLGFLTRKRMKAGICCPNALCPVRYIISKEPSGDYGYRCVQTHDKCPRKVALNEWILLKDYEETLPFYVGLAEVYTILRMIDSPKNKDSSPMQIEILTSEGDNQLLWVISREEQ